MNEIITFISHVAFNYMIPVVMGIGLITAACSSVLCIHFNYHYFIIYGKILWEMSSDRPSEVEKVKKMNSLKWAIGVSDAVLATTIITLIGLLASIMWPITIMLTLMLIILQIQKFLFRGKHRKLMFELKLKGIYHD